VFNGGMHVREVAFQIRALRRRSGLSIRELAEKAGVSAAMISLMERGRSDPSLTTLQKVLAALGTDLTTFFSEGREDQQGPVFPREQMRTVRDKNRMYTLVFPRRPEIAVQMFDETLEPHQKPEYETLRCDVAGYVLSGEMVLDIKGQKPCRLRPGDAFYVPKSTTQRGYALSDKPVRFVSLCCPPDY
jgi:transcriptional regulator with XRE-family HTH domain